MSAETITDLFLYKNSIGQTFRELLAERIRAQGIAWHKDHDPDWRDKPWMDGVRIDVDEDDQVEYLVRGVTAVIRDAVGEEFWGELAGAYLDAALSEDGGAA